MLMEPIKTKNKIKAELERASGKYHKIGTWIAIIFDPLFAITDYLNIPENWLDIFWIRILISISTLSLLLYSRKKTVPSYLLALFPFVLISIQNAFTFKYLDNEHILGHSLNYLALFIGAGLFVLWKKKYSISVVLISVILTAVAVSLNTEIRVDTFFIEGGILLVMVSTLCVILIQARYKLTVKEIKARLKLKESNKRLEIQTQKTEEKNKNITESINYAKRIQDSLLGSTSELQKIFKNSFILFRPKDILSGDFYYFYQDSNSDTKIIVAADCTGHGVPAALMTVLGMNALKNIIEVQKIHEPSKILSLLDIKIKEALSKNQLTLNVQDGMDATILVINKEATLFSGANNPVFVVNGTGKNLRIKGTRNSVGGTNNVCNLYETVRLNTKTGDKIYLFSDGYQDQYGGPNHKKYMSKIFRETLAETSKTDIANQNIRLTEILEQWQGETEQTDDILIIGLEI